MYDGEWREDKRHGRGKFLIGETGDEYVGEWKQGKADGYGVMTWVMGTKYEGLWKENRRNGHGKPNPPTLLSSPPPTHPPTHPPFLKAPSTTWTGWCTAGSGWRTSGTDKELYISLMGVCSWARS